VVGGKGNEIARKVAARFAAGDPVPRPPADTGAIPVVENGCSDTCASQDYDDEDARAAPNACEGSDCISYDFPMGFVGKGVKS
jgi:hypothetical protein